MTLHWEINLTRKAEQDFNLTKGKAKQANAKHQILQPSKPRRVARVTYL